MKKAVKSDGFFLFNLLNSTYPQKGDCMEKNTINNQQTAPAIMQKRIGTTTYQVAVHFSKTSKETIKDKIMRLIKNDTANGKLVNL